MMCRIYQVQA